MAVSKNIIDVYCIILLKYLLNYLAIVTNRRYSFVVLFILVLYKIYTVNLVQSYGNSRTKLGAETGK